MRFLAQAALVVRLETAYYRRHTRLLLAALAVTLIPAIYVLIYLESVWDPASHTGALQVALVNLDRDIRYHDQTFNLGREVAAKLKAGRRFGYQDMADPETARRGVREGRMAFALIIPADFSSNAVPGADPGAGQLEIFTSEGNSYQAANLARRFADDLGYEINERLNERRWALVLSKATGSRRSLEQLNTAVDQLARGAHDLAAGSGQAAQGAEALGKGAQRLDQGAGRLAAGARELGAGLRTLASKQPAPADLQRLKAGSDAVAGGSAELARGLATLQAGSQQLHAGAAAFRDEASSSLLLGGRVLEGAEQMADGLEKLDSGLRGAVGAQHRLSEGAQRVGEGVGLLTAGVQAQGSALQAMVAALPPDGQLDELTAGSSRLVQGAAGLVDGNRRLRDGAHRLATGIDLLADALPDPPGVEGSAAGLANSVSPRVVVEAPVQSNGAAYAPNIIPAALWLGAGIAAFLIHVRVLPREARDFSPLAQVAGKLALPTFLSLAQALLVLLAVVFLLQARVANLPAFALTLAVGTLTFLLIVFALTRAFGDAGKALSILFLAVQLSSSGGILPVELSGRLFMDLSPWMPLTWVVKAIKATLFGAYDQAWQFPLLLVAAMGAIAAGLAATVGKWRFVESSAIRPAVDF